LGGYALVLSRPVTVTDQSGDLSVQVPRSWDEKSIRAADGSKALLVSPDAAGWQANNGAYGVFMGVLPQATLPTVQTVSPPEGCRPTNAVPSQIDNRPTVTIAYDCSPLVNVVERYSELSDTELLRVQVRALDSERNEVLDSAKYK
jgi:hypothetical protein